MDILTEDDLVFYWLIFNGLFISILEPSFMGVSRVAYLNVFVKYNENYDKEKGKTFDF